MQEGQTTASVDMNFSSWLHEWAAEHESEENYFLPDTLSPFPKVHRAYSCGSLSGFSFQSHRTLCPSLCQRHALGRSAPSSQRAVTAPTLSRQDHFSSCRPVPLPTDFRISLSTLGFAWALLGVALNLRIVLGKADPLVMPSLRFREHRRPLRSLDLGLPHQHPAGLDAVTLHAFCYPNTQVFPCLWGDCKWC